MFVSCLVLLLSPTHIMKLFVVLSAVLALALAAPQRDAQILRYDSDNIGVGGYNYAIETSNGIVQQEQAALTNVGTDNEAISVRGQYSYTGDDGRVYTVDYLADENGFQPVGAHLPRA